MKIFVTGVNGQLGHDVMNELALRGHVGIGSDLAPAYSGMADGTAVTMAPYVSLDITDADAVRRVIWTSNPMRSFIVRLGRLSIWPKMTTKWLRSGRSMPVGRSILPMSARNWTARCSISVRIMCSTGRGRSRGSRTARITSPSTFMARPSSKGNWPFRRRWKIFHRPHCLGIRTER